MIKGFKIKIIIICAAAVLILLLLAGCTGISYIPGASYGYYIWEEDSSIIVEWSVDLKDTKFDGAISTDGEITGYSLRGLEEENDRIDVGKDKIEFSAALDGNDYSDGFSFVPVDYNYLEFDLKINGGYDLSRINVGGFLENPGENIFRIEKDYFSQLELKPWYGRHPFSEFFYKLYSNKFFTILYIFILGIIIIEILRVTVIARSKRIIIWIAVSYTALVIIDICVYFILRFLVLSGA